MPATITASPAELRSALEEILDRAADVDAADVDAMDAPADWDSGSVSFDPYI